MQLNCESFVFDPRPDYPLVSTVKRYWDPSAPTDDDDALTLIFTHGTGFHKEHWEAVIEDLVKLNANHVKIREYWAIDAPNHGDAAILNEQILDNTGFLPIFRWSEYARSVHAILAGHGTGISVDFSKRRLVAIGHSMGAVAVALSTTYYPRVNYETTILIEPMMHNGNLLRGELNFLETGAMKRRDVWPSLEDATTAFKSRPAWQKWDERVLDAYIKHGLRPLPTLQHPQGTGVTLKCPKIQEAATYRDPSGRVQAFNYMVDLVKRVPTHVWFGKEADYLPADTQQEIINAAGGPQACASVGRIEGGGHLVTQTAPHNVAQTILSALIPRAKAKM